MTDDFSFDPDFHGGYIYDDYDDTPAAKPSKFVLIGAIVSVAIGGVWAVVGALNTAGLILGFDAASWWGIATYFLTLLVPAGLIIYLRAFHFKHSKPTEDGGVANYDSHATQRVALKLRIVALVGFFFALFAIFIFVWPLAQRWSL